MNKRYGPETFLKVVVVCKKCEADNGLVVGIPRKDSLCRELLLRLDLFVVSGKESRG